MQNFTKGLSLQIQEAEQNSNRINPRKFCTRDITKLLKIKGEETKAPSSMDASAHGRGVIQSSGSLRVASTLILPAPHPRPPLDPCTGSHGLWKPGMCRELIWPFQGSLISRLFSLSFQLVPCFPQASRGARSPFASCQFCPPRPPTTPWSQNTPASSPANQAGPL